MSGSSAASVVTGFGTVGTSGLVRGFVTGFFDALTVAVLGAFVVSIGQRDGLRADAAVSGDKIRGRACIEFFLIGINHAGTAFSVRGTGEQGITLAGIAAVNVGAAGITPGEAEVVFGIGQENGTRQQKGIVGL